MADMTGVTRHNPPIMVLLIDDQPMVGELVRRLLESEPDISLHYCSTPATAFDEVEEIRPTVILQDLVMPNADGLEMVRRFRARPATAHTPIVVLSSKEEAAVKSEAFAAGANDYLVKLPDRIELLARIRYHSNAYLTQLQRDAAMRALRESQQLLLQANTALTQTNNQLNQFVGMAAHDLRNPLSAVLGFARLLLRPGQDHPPSQQQERFLTNIQSSAEFMLRLVNDLLDVSRIEAGDLNLEKRPTNLPPLVEASLLLHRLHAEEKQIDITLEADPNIPFVKVDPDKMEQVLSNLVSNALKFSQSRTTVRVSLNCVDGAVHLSVADAGPGIPATELNNLFRPFSRTSVKTTHGEKSTGLGLVIVKKVVDAHGGRIEVESEPGRGTTFTVVLPIH